MGDILRRRRRLILIQKAIQIGIIHKYLQLYEVQQHEQLFPCEMKDGWMASKSATREVEKDPSYHFVDKHCVKIFV